MIDQLRQAAAAMEELIRVRNHAHGLAAAVLADESLSDELRNQAVDVLSRVWRADNALDPEEVA